MSERPVRKQIRLKDHDYSQAGYYFITICVKDKSKMLGKIVVGRDDLGTPPDGYGDVFVELSEYGCIVKEYIEKIEFHYDVSVVKYVIMPNHIHMIILIKSGVPGSSRPTMLIPNLIAALKKAASRGCHVLQWQTSYHDHIIRNEAEYLKIWQYIDNNPARWRDDRYFDESVICRHEQ